MRGLEVLRTPLKVTPLPHLHEGLTAELADRRAGAPTCCDHGPSRLFLQIQSLVNPAALLFTCQMAGNVRLFLEGLTTGRVEALPRSSACFTVSVQCVPRVNESSRESLGSSDAHLFKKKNLQSLVKLPRKQWVCVRC